MIHFQISVKLNENLHQRLLKTASQMRMKTHAFVVNSLEETLNMIDNRDGAKVPLLVVQARTAQDYLREAPTLPVGSVAGPPENVSERCELHQPPRPAKTKTRGNLPQKPKRH